MIHEKLKELKAATPKEQKVLYEKSLECLDFYANANIVIDVDGNATIVNKKYDDDQSGNFTEYHYSEMRYCFKAREILMVNKEYSHHGEIFFEDSNGQLITKFGEIDKNYILNARDYEYDTEPYYCDVE